ncbi:MAG TPA: AAA family ATPase [Tepidisphaeraceae bacterium]|jgi:DNA transposition AAA+ family ATPase
MSNDDIVNRPDHLTQEARLLGVTRMLRDDQRLTPDLGESIVRNFRAVMARLKKSEKWAARSLAMSPTVLSQVLSGTYAADTEVHLRKIDRWVEIQHARATAPQQAAFARTSTALEIIGAAKMIEKIGGIAVVHGPSGIGKSLVAEYIARDTPGSIPIRVTAARCGIAAIYALLAKEVLPPALHKLAPAQIENALVDELADTNRLIVVDEIHELAVKGKDQGLHVLRHLQDQTDCPMLWLGTADIATYIETGRYTKQAVEQLYGRVTWSLDLTYAASRQDGGPGLHTLDDIRAVVGAHQWKVAGDGIDYLHEIANEPQMGGLRTVVRLCRIAVAKYGDKPLTRQLFDDLQQSRLGARAAGVVRKQIEVRARKAG